jgi:xanthine dehydrogenase accessory factor
MVSHFYQLMQRQLHEKKRLILMVVIANEGSSPGRKGFKMLVSENEMHGTIGGGIMEHKLVEYAQSLLLKPIFNPFVKHQIHDKAAAKDQSGMICSGRQTIAFFDVNADLLPLVEKMISEKDFTITYSNLGIHEGAAHKNYEWDYTETNGTAQKVYIVGGGHVGLALSETLSKLDFEIHMLDHRENLNTMEANPFVNSKQAIDFEQIGQYIPEGNDIYVVIMSFGYRTDDIIIRRLLDKNFGYIGMLGSKEKIATLFKNLEADGFDKNQISKVHAPIGIDIKSETTAEIAISIAAQLIQIRNQHKIHD